MTRQPSTTPEELTQLHATLIPRYKVLLHNDDRNSMDYVVLSLMQVFKFAKGESERIMLEAHHKGVALCVVEPLEQAELHRDQLHALSLIATIEPE
ncbi:MAG TPA: ATP-dependent Clp protease adaptor ClpS [Nitrospirota bacterium]|nr:ATP-dependent Clp protease adaptor ClpS [Nitrospirota bacterium]